VHRLFNGLPWLRTDRRFVSRPANYLTQLINYHKKIKTSLNYPSSRDSSPPTIPFHSILSSIPIHRRRSVPFPKRFLPIQPPAAGRDAAPVPLLPVTAQHPPHRDSAAGVHGKLLRRHPRPPPSAAAAAATDVRDLLLRSPSLCTFTRFLSPDHTIPFRRLPLNLLFLLVSMRRQPGTPPSSTAAPGPPQRHELGVHADDHHGEEARRRHGGSIPGRRRSSCCRACWRWKTLLHVVRLDIARRPSGQHFFLRNSSVIGLAVMTAT
jgi:hypothetical protein